MFYLRWLMFMWFLLECSIPSQASDGNWGPWENTWSICTRSCGGGIRLKRRYCHQGPSKDSCDGEAIQAQLCNIQPCPAISSQYEFKERQCAATNTQPDRLGRYTNWVPFDKVQKNRQCHVVCVPSESPDQKAEVREQSAIDGTNCEHDSPTWGFDKCVDGKCQKFGCDGELNSGTFFDVCGICGGTGNSCKKFSGKQTSGKFQEHVTFLTLTEGATSIKIVSSNAYTHIGVRVNGRWLLGPHSGRGKSRLYDSEGVHVQYKGGLSDSEYLSIKSIPNNITVSFSVKQEYDSTQYNGVDPVITYEYYLPTNHVAPAAVGSVQRYRWSLHYITGCTQTCGGGMQLVKALCVVAPGGSIVDNVLCNAQDRPTSTSLSCNTQACPANWTPVDIKQCTRSCGTRQLVCPVTCVSQRSGIPVRVSNDQCPQVGGSVNSGVSTCPYRWVTGHWFQCPASCGQLSVQTRQVMCVDMTTNEITQDVFCQSLQSPASLRQCTGSCYKQTNIIG